MNASLATPRAIPFRRNIVCNGRGPYDKFNARGVSRRTVRCVTFVLTHRHFGSADCFVNSLRSPERTINLSIGIVEREWLRLM